MEGPLGSLGRRNKSGMLVGSGEVASCFSKLWRLCAAGLTLSEIEIRPTLGYPMSSS